ncbi:MAG TPA: nuclear transport factor 2 family protein [Pyrinomonadaceae bacterium]|nr:nuclear transport factor 2 family protein [Pyrinomonadaceae bacterium]
MKKRFALLFAISFLALSILTMLASRGRAADSPQAIAAAIIAREKASVDAWQRKDKSFYADFMADDATYFSSMNPYLEDNPKENFLPKFEKYAEVMKFNDYQMFNPRVQVYGDTAILTYNSFVSASFGGQPMNYTAKVTSVYVKQGNTWRVVHAHESMNPAPR